MSRYVKFIEDHKWSLKELYENLKILKELKRRQVDMC